MEKQNNNKRITADKLNLTLAICAILISSASFYATYLQAESAMQQVKAATWPWLTFATGNFDSERKLSVIEINIKNAGTGPALIKNVSYHYKDQVFNTHFDFLEACCVDLKAFNEKRQNRFAKNPATDVYQVGGLLTSEAQNRILASGEELTPIRLIKDTQVENDQFWKKLDDARWKLKISVCYCSLLDDCYETQTGQGITQVEACPS